MLNAAAGMSPREVRIIYNTGSRHFLVHQANDFGEDNPSRHGHESRGDRKSIGRLTVKTEQGS
jgi:hypothetical protein